MTMDNDPGYFNPTPPRKSLNPFDSDDEILDMPGLESENIYAKEDDIGFDLKEFEKSANPLTFLLDNDDSLWPEAVLDESALSFTANGQINGFETDIQPDKIVTECESPEFVVCIKESTHHSVKDIGVDEGVNTCDKILNDNESKNTSSIQSLSTKGDDVMIAEKVNDELDVNEVPKPNLSSEWEQDVVLDLKDRHVNGLNQDMQNSAEDDSQNVTDGNPDFEEETSFSADWETTTVEMKPNDNTSKQVVPDSVDKVGEDHAATLEKKGSDNSVDKVESILVQDLDTGETLSNYSAEQGESNDKPDKILPDSRNITSLTNSEPGKQEDDPESSEAAKPPNIEQPTTSLSDSAGVPVHTQSSITFTGPVSYSGNVSIRSESSAASTRSFAFPVLQTEWNSSPVRMVRADRRKQRGWMQAVICCRF